MSPAVLSLVPAAAAPVGHEQFMLRPAVFVGELARPPWRMVLRCRRPAVRVRPPASVLQVCERPRLPPAASADLLAYRPKRRARKLAVVPAAAAPVAFAPRKLRPGARPRSMGLRPISEVERRQLLKDEAALRRAGILVRPKHEGDADCDDLEIDGPCPWVGCRLNLYAEVDDLTGALKLNFPDKEVWELEETCALRVVKKRGALSLEEVGKLINLTQERVSTIEEGGLAKMKRWAKGVRRV